MKVFTYNQRIEKLSRIKNITNTKRLSACYSPKPSCCDNQTVSFAPSALIHQCSAFLPSFGHMGEWLNADLREQGCAVWDTELQAVQGCPIEVLLQTPCYHIMWECLHMYSSAYCYLILLFICLLHFPANLI